MLVWSTLVFYNWINIRLKIRTLHERIDVGGRVWLTASKTLFTRSTYLSLFMFDSK